jgi:hypothetical protein
VIADLELAVTRLVSDIEELKIACHDVFIGGP